eukprot:1143372-Pelagomonas_calceolata.AAC.6
MSQAQERASDAPRERRAHLDAGCHKQHVSVAGKRCLRQGQRMHKMVMDAPHDRNGQGMHLMRGKHIWMLGATSTKYQSRQTERNHRQRAYLGTGRRMRRCMPQTICLSY